MTNPAEENIYSDSRRRWKHVGRGRMTAVFVVITLVCAAVITASGTRIYKEKLHEQERSAALNVGTFYNGIVVQGVSLGGMTMDEARTAVKTAEAGTKGTYRITVAFGKQTWELTEQDISFTYDTESVLQQAFAYARTGDEETRYQTVEALTVTPKEFSITAVPDYDSLKPKVTEIAAGISLDPTEPSVTGFDEASRTFSFQDGTAGYSADGDRLWADVKALAAGARVGTVSVTTKEIPFTGSLSDLKAHMTKLGTFQTVSTNNANGTYNMKKALLSADGACIPAGGTFSFFDTVGPCDIDDGYLQAGALLHGKHIDQYGGGICQASTTIYGAALRSNLTVEERSCHSLPSTYCKIGQDATVDYPYLDLKLSNPTDYPMYLVTETGGMTLYATFYGYLPSDYDSIEIVSQIDETIPALTTPVYTQDDTLAKGVIRKDQSAHEGYRASARRVYYKNGTVVRTEYLNSSYYPAAPDYYSYGPGTDLSGSSSESSSSPQAPSSSAASSSQQNPSSAASPSSQTSSAAG